MCSNSSQPVCHPWILSIGKKIYCNFFSIGLPFTLYAIKLLIEYLTFLRLGSRRRKEIWLHFYIISSFYLDILCICCIYAYINRFITGIICVRKCQQILNDAIWRMDCQSIWQRFAENLQESRELCPSLIIDSLAPSRVFLFLVETSFGITSYWDDFKLSEL